MAGAPDLPSYWLAILSEVVFSSAGPVAPGAGGAGGAGGGADGKGGEGDGGRGDEEEDEDGGSAGISRSNTAGHKPGSAMNHTSSSGALATPRKGGGAGAGGAFASGAAAADAAASEARPGLQALLSTVALRLRTRLFAAKMLLRLLEVVEGDPAHLDTSGMAPRDERSDDGEDGVRKLAWVALPVCFIIYAGEDGRVSRRTSVHITLFAQLPDPRCLPLLLCHMPCRHGPRWQCCVGAAP